MVYARMPSAFTVTYMKRGVHTRELFDNTVLLHLESLACRVRPPFLEFAFLVIESSSGIKCMLMHEIKNDHSSGNWERTVNSCEAT